MKQEKFEQTTSSGVEIVGELSFDEADSLNIPIGLALLEDRDENGNKTGYTLLMADNYQPRRDRIDKGAFAVRSRDPKVLRKIVKEKVVPLYKESFKSVEDIAEGRTDIG